MRPVTVARRPRARFRVDVGEQLLERLAGLARDGACVSRSFKTGTPTLPRLCKASRQRLHHAAPCLMNEHERRAHDGDRPTRSRSAPCAGPDPRAHAAHDSLRFEHRCTSLAAVLALSGLGAMLATAFGLWPESGMPKAWASMAVYASPLLPSIHRHIAPLFPRPPTAR